MGGVVATFLAGMLAAASWNYTFLVYLLGLIAVVLIGSVKAGKEAATTVMPLLSTALYLGQFLSPLIVSPIASAAHLSPYMVGAIIAVIYLLQAIVTRKGQMLPQ